MKLPFSENINIMIDKVWRKMTPDNGTLICNQALAKFTWSRPLESTNLHYCWTKSVKDVQSTGPKLPGFHPVIQHYISCIVCESDKMSKKKKPPIFFMLAYPLSFILRTSDGETNAYTITQVMKSSNNVTETSWQISIILYYIHTCFFSADDFTNMAFSRARALCWMFASVLEINEQNSLLRHSSILPFRTQEYC